MAIRNVAVMGNPVLRRVAEPVDPKEIGTPKFKALIQDMIDTMFEYDGRGLAAPQIHESLQVVILVWDFEPEKKPYLMCLINPQIKPMTSEESAFWEGCLSVPGLRGKVSRPNKISVSALDQTGKKLDFVAEGFAATVIQHECDHLLGKLYIDRLTDTTLLAFNKEYGRYHASENDESEGES